MNYEEPRRETLPSRLADVTPASAIFAKAERFDRSDRYESMGYTSRRTSGEWIGRTLRRHWWQLLPLWFMASGAIWYCLPRWFPNTFEASSRVQIAAGLGGIAADQAPDADFSTFKETQAQRIASPIMIAKALERHPDLGKQLASDAKMDPESAILQGISATLLAKTNLIQVTMRAPKDDGLADIVNAVMEAYLSGATSFHEQGVLERTMKLKNLVASKAAQVKSKRDAVATMVSEMGTLDAEQGRARHAAAIQQHASLSDQLLKTSLEVVDEQANLDRVKLEEATMASNPRPQSDAQVDAVAAFYGLPEIAALKDQLDQVKQKVFLAEREPGKAGEANRKSLQQKKADFQEQINVAWAKLSPGLLIAASTKDPTEKPVTESSKLEGKVNGLKARQTMLEAQLEKMSKDNLAGGSKVLSLEFARQDLSRTETVLETMTQTLSQAEVASNQPVARFNKEYSAKISEKSADLPRWCVGLAGPLVLFFTLLGFFGLVEKQTGRILDPSDLPNRARLNVIGLVPPLPKNRHQKLGLTMGTQSKSQLDLERFIQSLDQLRVVVCGRGDSQGRLRRSLLITSAEENEGKSTLAAQLAERSVNAGLLTLLIDADLRNPTLSRMFDRPDSVGLANVLRGELLAEEAIGVVAEAGGFHFLPAGLVRDDLARLLQSDRLARLLESARESFDLVLVDSPPVLPVADALTIGQWVDGAILTVRHKVSRLPHVERASQQLSSVGISIIGAVVSGVKDRYAPYYGSKPASDPDRGPTVS